MLSSISISSIQKMVALLLTTGCIVFILFSLFKKSRLSSTDYATEPENGIYNLVKLSQPQMDSLQQRDAFMFMLHRGTEMINAGNYDSSVYYFTSAIEMKPQAAYPVCQLGKAYLELKQYDTAISCFTRALEIKSDYRIAKHYKNIVEHRLAGDEDFN